MGRKEYCFVSGVLFSLVALAHLLRILYDIAIAVEAVAVPMLVSWITMTVTAVLASWAFRLSRGSSAT